MVHTLSWASISTPGWQKQLFNLPPRQPFSCCGTLFGGKISRFSVVVGVVVVLSRGVDGVFLDTYFLPFSGGEVILVLGSNL